MATPDILLGILPNSCILDFNLEQEKTCADMTLTNNSSETVMYKVKTTHPNWYVVKPNRGFLAAGESEKLIVELLAENKDIVIQKYHTRKERERCEKHRFMVVSTILPNTYDYNEIKSDFMDKQLEILNNVFNGEDLQKQSQKLRVSYTYPDSASVSTALSSVPRSTESGEASSMLPLMSMKGTKATSSGTTSGGEKENMSNISDNDIKEKDVDPVVLKQRLRKLQDEYDETLRSVSSLLASNAADKEKYDILRQQKRLKEKSVESAQSVPGIARSLETVKGGSGTSIFSLWIVLLFSVLSFVLGQYLSTTIATE